MDLADVYGNTPLHIAVFSKDLEMVKILVEGKANPRIKNKDALNAIDLCYTEKDKSLLHYFRSQPQFNDIFRPEE